MASVPVFLRDRLFLAPDRYWVGLKPFPDHIEVRAGHARLKQQKPTPLAIGSKAPALTSLSYIKGGPPAAGSEVVLFFFATSCGPCKAAGPRLQALEKERGLVVIAVTRESRAKIDRFLAGSNRPFPGRIAIDAGAALNRALGVGTRYPQFFRVAGGKVAAYQIGFDAAKGLTFTE